MTVVKNIFNKDMGDTFTIECRLCGYEVWYVELDNPNDPYELTLHCGNQDCDNQHTLFYLEDRIKFEGDI